MGKRGRGPKKLKGGMGYHGEGEVRMVRGKILNVKPGAWTCTIQEEGNNVPIEDVSVEPIFVNAEGGGSYWLPEVGTTVMVCTPSTGRTPFVAGGATLPKQFDEGDENEDPNDRRFNRPVIGEGDFVLAQQGTASLIMRKGGVLEIGASEGAKRFYIPLTNLIREFSQGWEHYTGGGSMTFLCRDNDPLYGSERTPAEFQLRVNEFCEDDEPMIDLRFGRIADEDDQKIPTGDLGTIVARFTIQDRFNVWVDHDGNYATYVNGVAYENYNAARTLTVNGDHRQVISKLLNIETSSRSINVAQNDEVTVGRDRKLNVLGNYEEIIGKQLIRQAGEVLEDFGRVERSVIGGVKEAMTGAHTQTIGDNRTIAVTGDSSETVASTKSTTVGHQELNPLNTSYQIYLHSGVFRVHDNLGKVVFSTGGPEDATAMAKIRMKPSGAIALEVGGAVPVAKFEINLTGVKISGAPGIGDITFDSKTGAARIGPLLPFGGVVTTLTHPVDRITGTPILGSSHVTVGGTPTIAGLSLLPVFVPDVTP